ncbi:HAD family hydrolase [Sinomicrobium weinanense]|uniref:HAD family hydrolase n=1 Tax=Sinomicrobium weinanense TaxID=2842200 RepID=A0A926JUX0_9FLAO|nr:HAD family hydrolase [Sinomicrobium weinanense]MBC9797673.1 HAD family hydrolase [Sinomicrobium weinanense]MBU3125790.1 HAD family hydrolase [Sinomicrobium weinanense]
MTCKILFSDIDGTLLNADRDLSVLTVNEIKRIREEIPVILVSARMPKQMYHLQEKLDIRQDPLVCYNGALVLVDEKPIHSTEIPFEAVKRIVDYNENSAEGKFHISLFNTNSWYVEAYDRWAQREENNTKVSPEIKANRAVLKAWEPVQKGAHKITCMGDAHLIEKAYQHFKEHLGNDLHLYRSKDTYIEIANREVSKLTGIQKLLSHYGLSLEEAMAFGDNYNDTEMIAAVGHGVAVANARDEVKAVANAITGHHKEDGVARYIQKTL